MLLHFIFIFHQILIIFQAQNNIKYPINIVTYYEWFGAGYYNLKDLI